MNQFFTRIMQTLPNDPGVSNDPAQKHFGWLMLTLLGIGATIGAGIFVMPGMIAGLAGPSGIVSFLLTGAYFCAIGNRYERFSAVVPRGVSAYSYTYYSMGELLAWVVGWGLFIEYFFGTAAVAIGFSEYLRTALGFSLPQFWTGPTYEHFGINIIAVLCVSAVTLLLVFASVHKSAKINAFLVGLKLALLLIFLVVGAASVNSNNWHPFMPMGWDGVLKGAALAVFPYVGFDALYSFARESKSISDTKMATYVCVGSVAILYILVMIVMTGMAPSFIVQPNGALMANPLFQGDESAAPLAKLLTATGNVWVAKFIAFGAVLGLFNVILVMLKGAPRIFRNMAEDGLLPPVFEKTHSNGNLVVGTAVTGVICSLLAGFVPFRDISEMMVLGTLVAFLFVGIGSLRLPPPELANDPTGIKQAMDRLAAFVVIIFSGGLAFYLNPLVLKVYCITFPIGLVIYFCYGYRHSKLSVKSSCPH